jgi:hypothetical protein
MATIFGTLGLVLLVMGGGAGHTLDPERFFYPTSLQMNESCESGSNGGRQRRLMDQRHDNPNIVGMNESCEAGCNH